MLQSLVRLAKLRLSPHALTTSSQEDSLWRSLCF